ncbi:predicted protein [Phaeodactylum tricornutum CCAP 1055/1]|uniref:RING-type domain-containing protein n=1 Tax=Phaeodactylum tricornutum (strain CCAP 1055/1) TaxID=556484 RepID=B7FTS8_PHATC|nr:predicted protein [Phaeodactylum tricornutum CCAP 1055/1]EEC50136.1 predicted protein [Phaeodactylum tricornutum CCAP 1055/1]|eukprot:XP_002178471.1 predicted protein [Phaeodactylum tricornutum CCAP 1055/1]
MMTIRHNWCSECKETCLNHATLCTICGSTLEAPPAAVVSDLARRNQDSAARRRTNDPPGSLFSFTMQDLVQEATQNQRRDLGDLRELLENIRQEIRATGVAQQDLLEEMRSVREEWQAVPAELWDPSIGSGSSSRPTSVEYLERIPRTVVSRKSSILRQGCLSCSSKAIAGCPLPPPMEVIPGEFGMTEACALEHGTLILPEFNRTGKGGLTLATKTLIANATKPVIVYMERGDGVTFCQKAITAQDAGASAVVIGNNVTEPWPYVMKDSKGEAVGDKVSIPIVMVKLADGQALVSFFRQRNNTTVECAKWNLRMEPQNQNCVICTESFSISEVLLRLPACGHHFHESCAMQWLTSHNTCPYCRRELPTDDAAYEQERRRTERTHASSDSAAGRSSQYQDFYG